MARLLSLILLLGLLSGAHAISVRQFDSLGCSAGYSSYPETGGFASGVCARKPGTGNSIRVTCDPVSGVTFANYFSSDCAGQPSYTVTNASLAQSNVCIDVPNQSGSVAVTCDESTITTRSRVTTYSNSACTVAVPGTTVYEDAAVGVCVPPNPHTICADGGCLPSSRAQYCSAGRETIYNFEFAGSTCTAASWTSAQSITASGAISGACQIVPLASDAPAGTARIYTQHECPASAGPAPLVSWPPGAPEERMAVNSFDNVNCTGASRTDRYTRLGLCQANDKLSMKMSCASAGGFYARTYFGGTTCDAAQLQEVHVTRVTVLGPSQCFSSGDAAGTTYGCPGTLNPASTFSAAAVDVAWISWVPGSNCEGGFDGPNWKTADLYNSAACLLASGIPERYSANATAVTDSYFPSGDNTCALQPRSQDVYASDQCTTSPPGYYKQYAESYSSSQSPAAVRFGLLAAGNGGSSGAAGGGGGGGGGVTPGGYTGAAASHGQAAAAASVLLALIVAVVGAKQMMTL